jgi:alkanesulfonate monooxygenase SsuD/methylene tetrahydromethanopterin reductase-like flavin-dependent oxidoreductase (luciferase family)
MKFGVAIMGPGKVDDVAVEAEKLGFDGVFLADHIGRLGAKDPWITLSYLAGKTTNIRLGTMVTPVPRYVPAYLATIISEVDGLSNGRVTAGFGTGYQYYEFRNFTNEGVYDFPQVRLEKYEEALRLILKLWTTPHPYTVSFKGKHYSVLDATVWPKPVQKPHPPVWHGGGGANSMKVAAELCDGWMGPIFGGSAVSPEKYEAKVKTIQRFAKKYNRDMSKFTFLSWGSIYDSSESPTGTVVKMDNVKLIEDYKAAGCQYWLTVSTLMHQFAKEIMPSFT